MTKFTTKEYQDLQDLLAMIEELEGMCHDKVLQDDDGNDYIDGDAVVEQEDIEDFKSQIIDATKRLATQLLKEE